MFKKYTSIENTFRVEFLDRIKGHGFWHDTFVVQEKAHGANLSFWSTDGTTFHAAKRTSDVAADEQFYNYQQVLEDNVAGLQRIWMDLKQSVPELKQITIFGELIGGDYPHPEVAIDRQSLLVQNGIYYSPKNLFYAFDIQVNQEKYLDVAEANQLFKTHGLFHAKTLFSGSIEQCLAYPNDFNSTLPEELGLPALTPNVAEGTIIRPHTNLHFNNGTRVILKNKNEKWAENKRFHKSIKISDAPSDQVLLLQEAILTYVTENRLNNVMSKIGEVTPKDFGRLLGMFSKDVVEDFEKDYRAVLDKLDKREVKQITKSFGKAAAELVKRKLHSDSSGNEMSVQNT